MTNEAKLNEAIKLFQEWSHSYSDELVSILSNKNTLEVSVFHECTEDVAELIANDANQKVLGQLAAHVHALKPSTKFCISMIWMKED